MQIARYSILALFLASCGSDPAPRDSATADVADADPADTTESDATPPDAEPPEDTSVDFGFPPSDTAPADTSPEDAAPEDTRPTPDTVLPEAGNGALAESCEAACSDRGAEPNNGGCPPNLERTCAEWCFDAGSGTSGELTDALLECIATDPLCFQTPLQCVLSLVFPEPFPHVVTLAGTGFEEFPRARVYAATQQAANDFVFAEGQIAFGEFELTLDVVSLANDSHLTLYYVDVNGDGACDVDDDDTGSVSLQLFNWPIDRIDIPDWRLEVEYDPEQGGAFICDTFR